MSGFLASIDFESQSACNLKKRGNVVYAEHPSTTVLILTIHMWATGEWIIWTPTYRQLVMPQGFTYQHGLAFLHELCTRPGCWLLAHNHGFEWAMWTRCLKLPEPSGGWIDSMDKCLSLGLPGALDKAGMYLFGMGKDQAGQRLAQSIWGPDRTGKLPVVRDDHIQGIIGYNVQDVVIQDRVVTEHGLLMEPEWEESVRQLHSRTNRGGIYIDQEFARRLRDWDEHFKSMAAQAVHDITGGQIRRSDLTRREFMRQQLNAQLPEHLALPNMQLGTLEDLLDHSEESDADEVDSSVIQVVKNYLVFSRAALAKVDAALNVVSADGRAYNQLRYWGAHTGRWSGYQIQVQNMKRPHEDFDLDAAVNAVLQGDLETFQKLTIDTKGKQMQPYDLLGSLIRGMIAPQPGCKFVISDFSQIEFFGLLWLAGDMAGIDEAVEYKKRGSDSYCMLATSMYGREITKKDKAPRQGGKVGCLACFDAETRVVTSRGVINLSSVTSNDRVWDGCEWVSTDGCIPRGDRETMIWNGVRVTPDHLFMLGEGQWKAVGELTPRENMQCLQSGIAAAPWSSSGTFTAMQVVYGGCELDAIAVLSRPPIHTIGAQENRPAAPNVHVSRQAYAEASLRGTGLYAATLHIAAGYGGVSAPYSGAASTRATLNMRTTVGGASVYMERGGKTARPCSRILYRSRAGITRNWRSTARTTTVAMSRAIYGSRMGISRCATRGSRTALSTRVPSIRSASFGRSSAPVTASTIRSRARWMPASRRTTSLHSRTFAAGRMGASRGRGTTIRCGRFTSCSARTSSGPRCLRATTKAGMSSASSTLRPVFDLANCGPRNRFMIVTDAGPVLVHNCGFGGGTNAVLRMADGMGIDLAEIGIDPQFVVDGYRNHYPKVVRLWREAEDAFRTVLTSRRVTEAPFGRGCRFVKHGANVRMYLPSGRFLTYANARMEEDPRKRDRDGNPRMAIAYDMAISGQVLRRTTYSGKIVENATQAFCRDLMADALLRTDAAGWDLAFHVHDEQINEVPDALVEECVGEVRQIMCTAPVWAPDMYCSSEPEVADRYKK